MLISKVNWIKKKNNNVFWKQCLVVRLLVNQQEPIKVTLKEFPVMRVFINIINQTFQVSLLSLILVSSASIEISSLNSMFGKKTNMSHQDFTKENKKI